MEKIIRRIAFFSLILTVLSSCITSKKVNYLQEPSNRIPAYEEDVGYEDYRLRVGDKLFVRLYSTQEEINSMFNGPYNRLLSSQQSMGGPQMDLYAYTVLPNGNADFPMVGEIPVLGLTIREATYALEKELEEHITFGSVEIRVLNRYFSIVGAGSTGHYPIIREKINIFQALALAGDANIYADRGKVRIIRETDEGTIIKMFDLRTKTIINSEFFYIEPNDVIYIQRLDEQFFSVINLPSLISTTMATISFGTFLYTIIADAIKGGK